MKRYTVVIPVTTNIVVTFNSDGDLTDNQAYHIACDKNFGLVAINYHNDDENVEIILKGWETHKKIVADNFCDIQNEFTVESE